MLGRAVAGAASGAVQVAGQVEAPQPPTGKADRVPSSARAKIVVSVTAGGSEAEVPRVPVQWVAPVWASTTATWPSGWTTTASVPPGSGTTVGTMLIPAPQAKELKQVEPHPTG